MNHIFEEVVDFLEESHESADTIFKKHDAAVKTAGKIIRPVSIILTIIGFYLLFMPIIVLLSWIPLVGSLLGMVFALAAAIFAFIVGGTVACLVVGLAWLRFRPLIGALLLAATALGVFLICFIDTGKTTVVYANGEAIVMTSAGGI